MVNEYLFLLFFLAILMGSCGYFCVKKLGPFYDSGKKPYLTRNLYVVAPSLLLFACLMFLNFGLGLAGLGGIYMHFFKKNDFEIIARNMETIDDNLNNPLISVSKKNTLLKKKENFIKEIEGGSLNNAVRVDLGLDYDDLYGSKDHNKALISIVNESLANASLENRR